MEIHINLWDRIWWGFCFITKNTFLMIKCTLSPNQSLTEVQIWPRLQIRKVHQHFLGLSSTSWASSSQLCHSKDQFVCVRISIGGCRYIMLRWVGGSGFYCSFLQKRGVGFELKKYGCNVFVLSFLLMAKKWHTSCPIWYELPPAVLYIPESRHLWQKYVQTTGFCIVFYGTMVLGGFEFSDAFW